MSGNNKKYNSGKPSIIVKSREIKNKDAIISPNLTSEQQSNIIFYFER